MSRVVKVAGVGEVSEDKGKVVRVGGRTLAIFRVKDEFFALENFCLHRGGPLGEGELDGYNVTCPWHGWTYDIRTGSFEVIPPLRVKTYPARQEGDSVVIDLDAGGPG